MNDLEHIGLGLRREIIDEIKNPEDQRVAFVELAPENWMEIGGFWRKKLEEIAEKYVIYSHGLSLSIGSPDDLDIDFVKRIRHFLDEFGIEIYSEHLSYSKTENAHLYDLLPVPFRKDVIEHIAERIKMVQDILNRPLILENISYYTPIASEMQEADFINEIIDKSGCKLLLDINNVYVNSFNHRYDAKEFLLKMPLEQVSYIHIAGHDKISEEIIIDTHGQAIIGDVYDLFEWTIQKIAPVPVLLERDFNLTNFQELKDEMSRLEHIAQSHWTNSYA